MTTREATTRWTGDLNSGSGTVSLDSSGLGEFQVSFPRRTGDPEGQTSPEELLAAALSSCMAMNLSGTLQREGLTAESIDVSAEATFSVGADGASISGIELIVRAALPGVDADRFAELAQTAKDTCPVGKALAGTKITLDAALA
ncbi:OsmC family peroxiredoxin [Spongisporangium articulatum]|uniref:OsmC family peroxiredoxin n=1 Tax=Spongisporangium articulatum TaxID=3362603 RepID=A0ABW8AHU8_9ACTN